MSPQQRPTECFDDSPPFDPTATCIGCHRPIHHHAPVLIRHPVFAGGIDLPDGRFRQLAVVCDECTTEPTLERCIWEARQRSGNPAKVRYLHQQVGSPEAQAALLTFVESLHR